MVVVVVVLVVVLLVVHTSIAVFVVVVLDCFVVNSPGERSEEARCEAAGIFFKHAYYENHQDDYYTTLEMHASYVLLWYFRMLSYSHSRYHDQLVSRIRHSP